VVVGHRQVTLRIGNDPDDIRVTRTDKGVLISTHRPIDRPIYGSLGGGLQ